MARRKVPSAKKIRTRLPTNRKPPTTDNQTEDERVLALVEDDDEGEFIRNFASAVRRQNPDL